MNRIEGQIPGQLDPAAPIEARDVSLEKQEELRASVEQEIRSAQTITDLAEAKRKSLSLDEFSGWRQEAAQDIDKKMRELLVTETQRLIGEKGFYE